jgi:hypothetical protein
VCRVEVIDRPHRLFPFAPHGQRMIVLPMYFPHPSFLEPNDDAALIDFVA